MRISEILNWGGSKTSTLFLEGDTKDAIDEVLRSVLIPLVAQNVNKITIDQIMDLVQQNPTVQGVNVDASYISTLLSKNKLVTKVQADPENGGEMTAFFKQQSSSSSMDQATAERQQAKIKSAAMKTLKSKMS